MYTLKQIANFINAELIGDYKTTIISMDSLSKANAKQLSYAVGDKYKKDLINSKAGAIITNKKLAKVCPTNALIVSDVYLAFATISHYFKKQAAVQQGISTNANTSNAKIATGCIIGNNVVLGNNCIIGANSIIQDNITIGDNAYIYPNVTILQGCSIGNNVILSPGVVIGSEGFGNAQDAQKRWHSIAHLGNVIIGNNVEIGANTVIDRGVLEDTEIHDGVKIDNLVHIAHNVIIGENSVIAASSAISGSVILGKRCAISGLVGIGGHLHICDDTTVNMASTVNKNIKNKGVYTGIFPIAPHKQWQNISLWLLKLDKIIKYLDIKLKHLKN